MIQNAFNTPRLCMITGEIKTGSVLTPSSREHHINGMDPKNRKELILKHARNSIHIPTPAESARTRNIAGRRVGV